MAVTKIRGLTQIKEGSIYDVNIADDANIKTSKLEDGDRIAFLDGSRVFTGDLNLGNHRITNLADGVSPNDAVTKRQLDAFAQGLDVRESCRVATTGPITLSGLQQIDGVVLQEGDRVLVKDQENPAENGIYIASETAWNRAPDFDEPDDIDPGVFVFIEEGEKYKGAGFVVISDRPQNLGTDPIRFSQFTGLGQVTAGLGLWKDGNYIAVGEGLGIRVEEDTVNVKLADTSLKVDENGLAVNEGGITTAKLADRSITGAKLDPSLAGPGITLTADKQLAVNPDGETLEITSDIVRVKDGGITTSKLSDNAVVASKINFDETFGEGFAKNTTTGKIELNIDETIFDIVSGKLTIPDNSIAPEKLKKAPEASFLIADSTGVFRPVQISGDIEISSDGTARITGNVLNTSNIVVREIPTGDIDGTNRVFTLANTPVPGTEMVFVNGILLDPGDQNDYVISGKTIEFTFAPQPGDKIRVTYIKK